MSKKVKMHKNFLFYSFRHACGVPPSPTVCHRPRRRATVPDGVPPSPTAGETLSPKVTEGVVQNDEQFKICSFIVFLFNFVLRFRCLVIMKTLYTKTRIISKLKKHLLKLFYLSG